MANPFTPGMSDEEYQKLIDRLMRFSYHFGNEGLFGMDMGDNSWSTASDSTYARTQPPKRPAAPAWENAKCLNAYEFWGGPMHGKWMTFPEHEGGVEGVMVADPEPAKPMSDKELQALPLKIPRVWTYIYHPLEQKFILKEMYDAVHKP